MFSWIKSEIDDYKILLRNAPVLTMIFLVMSIIGMNLGAGKELLNIRYLALDCGFLLSWMSFLCMDMLTKRFGAKAAIKISLLGLVYNLIWCGITWIFAHVGNNWSAYYAYNDEIANAALNDTFGGTWYILLGSTIAMAIASVVNALINEGLGKILKKNTFIVYAIRSYVSTAIGQFIDNLAFALIVSVTFFGWNMTQVIMCSLTGAVAELLAEIVFSPVGYKACRNWEKTGIGQNYLDYLESQKSA